MKQKRSGGATDENKIGIVVSVVMVVVVKGGGVEMVIGGGGSTMWPCSRSVV